MKKVLKFAIALTCAIAFVGCSDIEESTDSEDTITTENTERSAWSITGSTFTHDPSVIYEKSSGLYWMFYTADGIGVKYSTDGKNWIQGTQIFASAPSWWSQYVPGKTDFNVWAPDISYYNGYYNLYYSVSTFGSNVSCIGLIRCTSIVKGDWVDQGLVLRSTKASKYNCIDPNFVLADKTPYLVFGSWYDGIWIVRLSSGTMKPNKSAVQIADRDLAPSQNALEGPCIWARGNGYYYLFCSYDKCCAGTNSTYNIRYGRSKSITGPYLDKNGVSMLDNGGTVLLKSSGNQIGPGGQTVFTTKSGSTAICYHYYDAKNNGTSTLAIRDIKTVNGWPVLY